MPIVGSRRQLRQVRRLADGPRQFFSKPDHGWLRLTARMPPDTDAKARDIKRRRENVEFAAPAASEASRNSRDHVRGGDHRGYQRKLDSETAMRRLLPCVARTSSTVPSNSPAPPGETST